MVSPSLFWKRVFVLVFLVTFYLNEGCPVQGQDAPPPAPPLAPPGAGPDAAPGGDQGFVKIPNAPVGDVLDIYERLAGKHLIRDAQLLTGVPTMTIDGTGLNKAEFLKLIETTLLLNGVAIVPVDSQTVKIIVLNQQKSPRNEGVKLYANAADLPAGDVIVSYYMPLQYISPGEAVAIFKEDAPNHPSYGAYVPAPSAQAVILTESTSVIRELIALRELIDVPPASVVSEFVQLSRADAEKVAEMLNKLLTPQPGVAGATPVGASIVPPLVGNLNPLLNEHNLLSGTAQIIPDPRSNRLLVITRPVNMPFLRQLIGQLDQPDIFTVPQRRSLKYVLAQDILPALEASLAQGKDEEKQIGKDQPAGGNKDNQNNSESNAPSAPSTGGSTGSAGSVSAITPELKAPSENNVPTVVTIGKTRLLADNRSNSIIVFGSPDVTGRVFNMIDELDRKPLQVYLATVIGQLTLAEGEEFGIDFLQKYAGSSLNGVASSSLTTGRGVTAGGVPDPATLLSSAVFPLASGLTLYGQIGGVINAYVRALETTNRFKVISRPSVYTTNNKLAVIASGSQVPVPSNITSGFNGTTVSGTNNLQTTANIVYQNVLLQLDIVPLINANHEVTLKIRQTDNTLGANNVISGNNVPTINTQEINTEVTVKDKSTVVIGGLISDTTKRDETGVPILSDIPVLGYLFKDTTKSKERDELIILIQPTVVETEIDQIAVDEAEKHRTVLGQEAERAANGFSEDVPRTFQLPPLMKTTTTTTTTSTKVVSPTYSSKASSSTKAATPASTKTSSKSTTTTVTPTADGP